MMRSWCKAAVLSLSMLALASVAGAAWVPMEGGSASPPTVVATGSGDAVTLRIEVPGYDLGATLIDGRPYAKLGLPGEAWLMEKGLPELPMIARSVAIAGTGVPSLRIVASEWSETAVDPVLPSKGHLTRDLDPAGIPFTFDALYRDGGIYPREAASLGDPYIVRDERGVALRVVPFQYDADRGVLRVLRSMTLEVVTKGTGGLNELAGARATAVDPEFARIYRGLFANYGADKYAAIGTTGRMLVVTADAYQGAMAPFVAWKQQKGIPVEVITMSSVGGTATGVQNAITSRYGSVDGLTYVVLVGDIADVPTRVGSYESADSDPTYAMVAGTDRYPDLFVSRISASNVSEVQLQVAKFVRYERDPDTGAAAEWYHKGTGLASNEGSPTDYERCNLLRTDMLAYTFTFVDQIYQPTGTAAMISAALNEGRSLVNYIGHGSGTSWSNPPFANSNVLALTNGWKQPWLLDVSCSNGDFSTSVCFAEAWLRAGSVAQPHGAVASYSASTLASWVPPCEMQAHAVDLLVAEQASILGALYYYGGMQVLDTYPTGEGPKLIEQYNIFGDCSLMVRTDAPLEIAPEHLPIVHLGTPGFQVDVGVPGAVACLYRDGVIHGTAVADAGGLAYIVLDVPVTTPGEMTLTVTGYNLTTYQATLLAINPSVVVLDPDTIDANVPTDVTVTVYGPDGTTPLPGIDVWAEGLDYTTAPVATDASGVAVIGVTYPFGPSLDVVGRDPAETYELFRELLTVNALALTSPDLTVTTDIGMTDLFPLNLPGTLHATTGEAGATLHAVLPNGTVQSTGAASLTLTAAQTGVVTGIIALSGYDLYTETFDVVEAYGQLTGRVTLGGSPAVGAVVRGLDGDLVEVFSATTNASGDYDVGEDVLVDDYTIVVDVFGYLHFEQAMFLNYGPNTFDVAMVAAPSGVLTGLITDAATAEPLQGIVRVYRSDNGALHAETTSDVSGVFTTAALPYFTYTVVVRASHHVPASVTVEIDAASVVKDFALEPTNGDILIVDDDGVARWAPDKFDEKGQLVAEGYAPDGERSTSVLTAELEDLGYGVTVQTAGATVPADWPLYDLVVVAAGANTNPLSSATLRTALIAYVQAGGHLLLEGGEVAYKHYGSGAFASTVMHTNDWNHDSSGSLTVAAPTHHVMSVPNTITGPITITYAGYGDQDAVAPLPDAQLVGGWSTYPTDASVICYDPNPAPAGGQIAFFCFNYATLNAAGRAPLLENTVRWLLTPEFGGCSVSGRIDLQGSSDDSGVLVEGIPNGGTTYTDAAGNYSLPGLYAGSYTIRASKAAWSIASTSVTLAEGQQMSGVNLTLTPVSELTQCLQPALPIADYATVNSPMTLAMGAGVTVTSVEVFVDITHTYQGDLTVDLRSPAGTTVRLHNRTGSSTDNIYGWYPGTLTPAGDLGLFAGQVLDGIWTLTVADLAGGDIGTLNEWCLKIVYGGGATAAGDAPSVLSLAQNYPNPFNPSTQIAYTVPRAGQVELRIFDLAGRQVRTLVSGELAASAYVVEWNGRDDTGRQAASGTYYYRLRSEGQELTRKMTLLK
jgi:subtilisin-like proprotein convertase family protein